jgi:hypothetical protein
MSLKSNLQQIIKDRKGGIYTLNELEDYCHKANYKLSNAERRLRRSESPDIERVYKNGAIIGYKYEEHDKQTREEGIEQTNSRDTGIERQVVLAVRETPLPGFSHLSQRYI